MPGHNGGKKNRKFGRTPPPGGLEEFWYKAGALRVILAVEAAIREPVLHPAPRLSLEELDAMPWEEFVARHGREAVLAELMAQMGWPREEAEEFFAIASGEEPPQQHFQVEVTEVTASGAWAALTPEKAEAAGSLIAALKEEDLL